MSDLLYDASSGHFSGVTPCEPAKSSPEDADDLVSTAERVCGEAYQLLSAINYCYPAMIPNAERWLDNLSRARLVHDDLLPVTIARPPASEAQAPAVPELEAALTAAQEERDDYIRGLDCRRVEIDGLHEQLAQLRARVAILDAQEARLPELTEAEIIGAVDSLFWDSHPSSFNAMPDATHNRQIIEAFRMGVKAVGTQLLDAQRAVQAWRKVARGLYECFDRGKRGNIVMHITAVCDKAIAAYDVLAGKGE